MESPLENFFNQEEGRPKTATTHVTDALRKGILSGKIPGGAQLKQDELAEKFGVSRMPIRDAIKQLEAEGLLTQVPHKGAYVTVMTQCDIVELFDMRIMAETEALRIGFSSITADKLQEMVRLCEQMEQVDDPVQLSESNRKFHVLLYEDINRPRLLMLINSLYESVDRYLRMLLIGMEYNRQSQADHRRFYEACQARDLQAAQQILASHLVKGRDEVLAYLTKQRGAK